MSKKFQAHSFHIPVMGLAYTVDSPIKVAKYGISSVISIVDDILIEKMNEYYSKKFELPFKAISTKVEDYRAKRITSYLNTVDIIVKQKFENLKKSYENKTSEFEKYMEMLPDFSELKQSFLDTIHNNTLKEDVHHWIQENLVPGSIDVNIMTKLDKVNYKKKEALPSEYNDAHAALRGFANSNLTSSVVLSAGMNPRLYAYFENFEDFFPNEEGYFKKKIILKVSDYRSAIIQGKFLAKKGLWVSEYRIESGLNCGGHAFATDGYLLGPVLAEFKEKREELESSILDILNQELINQGRTVSQNPLTIKISAQGGVGTEEEHEFLLNHYQLDSIGWGTPFLLVPEATTVDEKTLNQLVQAKEEDLYLSDISPLGVPFNNLKANTKDLEKEAFITKGRPGSSCPKKFVSLNKEFKETGICTASREYQYLKIKELDTKELSAEVYQDSLNKITEKTCTCVGLGTSALLAYNLDTKVEGEGVSICPGPNMAYYSKIMSLKNMTDHIYGRDNMISRTDRPNMFIKELHIYLEYLKNKLLEAKKEMNKKEEKYLLTFTNNMKDGILYYENLFNNISSVFEDKKQMIIKELEMGTEVLERIHIEIESLIPIPVKV